MSGFPSPFKATALQNGPELFQDTPQGDQGGTDARQGGPARSRHPIPAPRHARRVQPAPTGHGGVGKTHVSPATSTSPGDLVWESLCR